MKSAKSVDEFINNSPKEVQGKLKELRTLIKSTAPIEEERISYGMPYYSYKGRLIYFGLSKNHIGLYIPPPIIENHKEELKGYVTTKSAIHLPKGEELPVELIKKLIKARVKHNEEQSKQS